MLNAFFEVNWLAIGLATVASFLLGGIWFVVLVGKLYAKALGREAGEKPGPLYMFGPLVCNLLTTITTAVLLRAFQVTTLHQALSFGAVVGIGYFGAHTVNIAINPNFPRPFLYGLINVPYFLLVLLMSCAILTAM
jgi:hypothetical protein